MFQIERENFIDKTMSMPGALSVLFLLSVILPAMSIFPSTITLAMMTAFSVPIIFVFLAEVAVDRRVSIKKSTLLFFPAYLLYMLSRYPWSPMQYYLYSFFFVFGALLSVVTYAVYYIFIKIGRKIKSGKLSFRWRFLLAFIPSLFVMLILSWIISIFIGAWMFEMEKILIGGVEK